MTDERAGDPRTPALRYAVCDAYGWPPSVLNDEEEILRRLLALNLQRAHPPNR